MFRKRHDEVNDLAKVALCWTDTEMTRAAADRLAQRGICKPVAVLSDTPKDILWLCRRERPDLLLLEAVPDAMERFDDPDKDIAGRCRLSARIAEEMPACRVYLVCAEEFRRLEPVMQKAVETHLIRGYCFGGITVQQLEHWLGEAPGPITLKGESSCETRP